MQVIIEPRVIGLEIADKNEGWQALSPHCMQFPKIVYEYNSYFIRNALTSFFFEEIQF
jgi:hypothetical protein